MDASETYDNVSSKFDIGSWTVSHLKTAVNLTHYAPSAKDLLLAGPRIGMKVGSFIFALPETIDDVLGGRIGQRVISEATNTHNTAPAVTAVQFAREMAQTRPDVLANMQDRGGGVGSRLLMESGRNFGNIFQYATSRWSLACIIMAIVLNRTHIYASSRRNLTLGFKVRLALRMIPIVLFAVQARWLLQSIQCQTSPEFGTLRWGNANKTVDLMFTQNGGPLHTISSTLLLGASDADSCRNVKMVPAERDLGASGIPDLAGSLSLLWPLFETLCFSQFIETISCAIQGRQVAAETGMTLFEHSLAFAESDAAVSSSLGLGPFAPGTSVGTSSHSNTTSLPELAIKRSMIMSRVNTPPEVLLVGFLSSMNHITSHILAIFNMQGRLRLLSTAFWGLSFMSIITWSIFNFSIDDDASQGLLRFPTVCIIGFIPHVLVLAGIVLCSLIYGLALVLTALALPTGVQSGPRSFLHRLTLAHENMQANVPLSNIRISMHMDFYTALLKTGFSALTMASEAVYLNESPEVDVKQRTWLEDDRLREIEATGAHWLGPNFRASGIDSTADGVGLVSKDPSTDMLGNSVSGFARERTAQKSGNPNAAGRSRVIRDGVGATERSGRWIMAFEFFLGIFRLLIHWWATLMVKVLTQTGVRYRPQWLMRLVTRPKNSTVDTAAKRKRDPETLDFWLLGNDGELMLPANEHVDVEAEMRRRLKDDRPSWSDADEEHLESKLYNWWLNGGWWGGDDSSGTYVPQDMDDDTTSVVSTYSESSEANWESDDSSGHDDGRRTPTQDSFRIDRVSTPVSDSPLSSADLARLLHPETPQERADARALAAHLASDTIVTRSRYRDALQRERARVLTSTRRRQDRFQNTVKLTPEEEAQILEHLIISRRSSSTVSLQAGYGSSWAEGASGLGDGGPQCVVCQSAPRSIIVWPCRCLSLCDDCRVTLAMNNFDKCVCCRRDVGSFSRIFVP